MMFCFLCIFLSGSGIRAGTDLPEGAVRQCRGSPGQLGADGLPGSRRRCGHDDVKRRIPTTPHRLTTPSFQSMPLQITHVDVLFSFLIFVLFSTFQNLQDSAALSGFDHDRLVGKTNSIVGLKI